MSKWRGHLATPIYESEPTTVYALMHYNSWKVGGHGHPCSHLSLPPCKKWKAHLSRVRGTLPCTCTVTVRAPTPYCELWPHIKAKIHLVSWILKYHTHQLKTEIIPHTHTNWQIIPDTHTHQLTTEIMPCTPIKDRQLKNIIPHMYRNPPAHAAEG